MDDVTIVRPGAAHTATTRWLWLLDPAARTDPTTLPALLEFGDQPAASLVVDAAGAPLVRCLGRVTEDDTDGLLDAAVRRCAPLRHIRPVSLLVETGLAAEVGPFDARLGAYAGVEWTARLFARRRGVLVPASRVTMAPPPRPTRLAAARMARTGVWRRGETLRELIG